MKRTGEHERDLEDLERGEAQAPPAPATAAGDVLALQRSAGNRAVAGLLARDATKPAPPKPKNEAAPQGTGMRVLFPGIGEIPIETLSWGTSQSLQAPGHRGNQPGEIFLTSKVGDHSEPLMKAMLRGEARDVEVVWPQGSGGVVRLKFKVALVASYNVSSQTDPPIVSWSLTFEEMEYMREDAKEK